MTLIVALIVLILSIVNICFVARRTLGISSFCPGRQNEKVFFLCESEALFLIIFKYDIRFRRADFLNDKPLI